MRVRSSSVASVSTLWRSVTSSPLRVPAGSTRCHAGGLIRASTSSASATSRSITSRAGTMSSMRPALWPQAAWPRSTSPSSRRHARAHPREHVLGLGEQPLDHLTRGHDVLDEACALAAGGVAAVHVALLARADGRGEAHALGLEGERQNLRRPLLPLSREFVADGAARLAGSAAMHHRPFLVDGHDLLLVVVVSEGLVGGDEARAHPDAHCAEGESGDEAAAVGDAARRQHRERAYRVHYRRHEDETADAAGVPTRLVALGDDRVHAVLRVIASLLHVAAEGHDLHAELVGLRRDGTEIAEPGHQHRHALLQGHVDPALDLVRELLHLVAGGADDGEEHVHPEGLIGLVAHATDLLAEMLGRSVGRRDDAEAARGGDGGGERGAGDPAHAGLTDRIADPQQIAKRGAQGLVDGACHAQALLATDEPGWPKKMCHTRSRPITRTSSRVAQ